jgi:WD40 repeat protein
MAFSADGRLFFRSQQVGKGSADNLVVHDTSTWNQLWGLQTAPVQPETLALSSDGKAIALGGNERVVSSDGKPYLQPKLVIVDTDSRTLLRSFNVLAPGCEVQFVAWRPGSRIVAVGGRPVFAGGRLSTAAVGIFDADTGTLLGEYTHAGAGHQQGLAYTPDGRYLIIAWDGVVEIWDGQHTALRQSIATDAGAVSVSRDGRYLGIGGLDKSITVWELR